ncbi:nitrogen regulatory protein PII [Corynebacterium maris DSM 45190]|uniref:Nitrogen regulatory protein PII n=1 Tax=Corynebacterium maris DSM 45190 TaxID=1224163 RepID=S5T3C6_9CORY|nr:P-II family nitrogen regulator [Corynebacterium maris]AGS35140.1 nitrogen regulatory protein PII [Corynebacterium maris DSM 45190]
MKLVTAVVKPFTLGEIHSALDRLGVSGMTATETLGYGRQRGHTEVYRGAEIATEFVTKIKVEVLISDAQLDEVCDAVIAAAHTGEVGDGKLWVTEVDRVVRVRTGETNEVAV